MAPSWIIFLESDAGQCKKLMPSAFIWPVLCAVGAYKSLITRQKVIDEVDALSPWPP
jgi:hypothetical protein